MTRPLLLGHRGAKARAPENTRASLRQAIADGADGFEFDVRATGDGVCVLLHDATLDRTTNGDGALADVTYDAVGRLDAGSSFAPEFAGEPVPTLAEVLDEHLGAVRIALEMKETLPARALEDLSARLESAANAWLVVASFQQEPIARAKRHLPIAPRARILRRGEALPDEAERSALELWGVFSPDASVDERWADACRDAGLACFVYTVNEPERAATLARWGIDGIISDDPAAVRPALG